MDMNNPAISDKFKLPPALLQQAGEDFASMAPVWNMRLAAMIENAYHAAAQPGVSIAQKIAVAELLGKASGALNKQVAVDSAEVPRFSVVINLSGGKTIDTSKNLASVTAPAQAGPSLQTADIEDAVVKVSPQATTNDLIGNDVPDVDAGAAPQRRPGPLRPRRRSGVVVGEHGAGGDGH